MTLILTFSLREKELAFPISLLEGEKDAQRQVRARR
jgi:hypothetical protein